MIFHHHIISHIIFIKYGILKCLIYCPTLKRKLNTPGENVYYYLHKINISSDRLTVHKFRAVKMNRQPKLSPLCLIKTFNMAILLRILRNFLLFFSFIAPAEMGSINNRNYEGRYLFCHGKICGRYFSNY